MEQWWGKETQTSSAQAVEQRRGRKLESRASYIRLVLAAVLIPVLVIFHRQDRVVIIALVVGLLAVTLLASYLSRRYEGSRIARNIAWPVVLAVVIALIALTGGAKSDLWLLIVFPILGAVARFNNKVSAIAVGLCVVAGVAVVLTTPGIGYETQIVTSFTLAVLAVSLWMFGDQDEKTHEEAIVDPLTELLNRHHMNSIIAKLDKILEVDEVIVSVVVIDVDHFKAVNDKYGHTVGDSVLRGVAEAIHYSIRGTDIAFRAGGEEFAVVLPGAPPHVAHRVAERLRNEIEASRPGFLRITASCGVASAFAGQGVDMRTLLERADKALYQAKEGGRNRVCVA